MYCFRDHETGYICANIYKPKIYINQKISDKFSENNKLTGISNLKVIIYPEFTIKIPYRKTDKQILIEELYNINYNEYVTEKKDNYINTREPYYLKTENKYKDLLTDTIYDIKKYIGSIS